MRNAVWIICFLLNSFSAFPLFADTTSDASGNSSPHQSTMTAMHLLLEEFNLPSLSVAIAVDDKIVFADAIGYADVALKRRASAQTQYSVGSIAKPMTAIALGRLMDAGKIRLDDSVHRYLSDYQPLETSPTIRQLAAHTAGIPHETPERERREFTEVKDHKSPFESLNVFSAHKLLFLPGSKFTYSSNGYILLSAVIESVAQLNYVEYMNQSVWSELGMRHTELDTSVAGKNDEASYYAGRDENGEFLPASKQRDRSFLFGAGGFISTPTDLVRMSAALYREGFLSKETRTALLTPVKLADGSDNPEKYALGWRIGQVALQGNEAEAVLVAHHGGVTDGAATAYLLVIPARKAAIAFATNMVPKEFWKMRPRAARILTAYFD